MTDPIYKSLIKDAELTNAQIERTLAVIGGQGIDGGDLYFQQSESETWSLEEERVDEGARSFVRGVGVRAWSGEKTGFAYSQQLAGDPLLEAAQAARAIAKGATSDAVRIETRLPVPKLYGDENPLLELRATEKAELLKQADRVARAADPRIQRVSASLSCSLSTVAVIQASGQLATDIRPLVSFSIDVVAVDGKKREGGRSGFGGRRGLRGEISFEAVTEAAAEAARLALNRLEAVPPPAGDMVVVLGPGWPGILLHEAVGHGLEADFNRKGVSAFSGRLGERVAAPGCTLVDDGTLEGRRGSLTIDDEGTASQQTVLIEDGYLRGYMQDRFNAGLTGAALTGNGRRQSYAHMPMPRMTNTYMIPGSHEPGEIIESVKYGLYATQFSGGQVDIVSGKFVFSMSECCLIENGRLTRPLCGATLIGNGPEALKRISMIGNDLELDKGIGTCGKDGQSVAVGVGQPTLRLDGITVGGEAD